MNRATLAIVGGGFSGAALAIRVLESGVSDTHIHIFEPRPALGWGIAYGDARHEHILNVPAARMSLHSDRPNEFLDWAHRHGPRHGWPLAAAATGDTYLPRRLFGHYVEAMLQDALKRGGPTVQRHHGLVTAIARQGGGFVLSTERAEAVTADTVVLATGFCPPSVPFPVEGTGPAFVADPWVPGNMDAIGPKDSVLIVGTGLTMIDTIYALTSARHRGSVTAISRHGLLPRVHGITQPVAPVVTADDAARGIVQSLMRFRHALSWGRADWRSLIDGLRPITDQLWAALPPDDQDRFLRHLRPVWEVHRHRMAAESSDLLLRRIAQGLLSIEAARLERLHLDENGALARLRRRHAPQTQNRHFDWVINCTPPAAPLDRPAPGLAKALLDAGLVRPHRSGLGFDVDDDGRLRDGEGNPVAGFYTVGPPRRGHAVEATAVPHIRPQLDQLVPLLLDRTRR